MDQTPDTNEWIVVVNPNAGNGKGKKDWKEISGYLHSAGLCTRVHFTESKGHAVSLVREMVGTGYRKFLTVGGDGTLNEVLNGVFIAEGCNPGDVTLALIPVGTGNDWGRMFGIPLGYKKAVEIIAEGRRLLHDVGVVSYNEGDRTEKRYFINTAGLGFEAVVVKRTNRQKDKGRGGKAIYFYSLLMTMLFYHNTSAEITADGIRRQADVFSVNVGNGRYCGGGMSQTPGAIPDDGLLDVTVINGMGKAEIIMNLNILYNGKILSHPKIDGYKCRDLRVESDSVLWVEADGESLGHTPAEFTIIPGGINIIYGSRITRQA